MFVFGVRNTLSPVGRYQLVVRYDVRYVNHIPQQRKSEPSSGAGKCTHIEVHQIQFVCLGRAVVVGDIGQHNASDDEPPDHEQPQPVQLLVSITSLIVRDNVVLIVVISQLNSSQLLTEPSST